MIKILPPEERMRRYKIIQSGVGLEFWSVLKDSLVVKMVSLKEESLELSMAGKEKEARDAAVAARAILYIINEPHKILKENDNLFKSVYYKACEMCGNVTKKYKDIIYGEKK